MKAAAGLLLRLAVWAAAVICLLLGLAQCALAALPAPGEPGAPRDPRYCGEPARDKHGRIVRSPTVRAEFARIWPKPDDGQEWFQDHVIPRANGGCDKVINLQWLPARLKTCPKVCKDRFERRVYAVTRRSA